MNTVFSESHTRCRPCWFAFAIAALTNPHAAMAADAVVADTGVAGLGRLLLALIVVLAAVAACAWLARRLRFQQGAGGGVIKVAGGTMIGARERVIVLEIADTWIVAGVSPAGINALHTLPRPALHSDNSSAAAPSVSFSARLRELIEKRRA